MTDSAPFHELTFLIERILFEDGGDAQDHHRCVLLAAELRKSPIGYPAARQMAEALGLVVGNRLNAKNGVAGAFEALRAWEAVAGSLHPLVKRERAEEFSRRERARAHA